MLLFFYAGFLAGTVFCGLAPDYKSLLTARIITGLFGGVMGAVVFAITTDLFEMQVRGRVMGFVQMAFAASQVSWITYWITIGKCNELACTFYADSRNRSCSIRDNID